MQCTRQLHQNLLLHFAEQPRFMAYKLLQLTVEVCSSEGGLCMAAPLQRSGEYDVFLKGVVDCDFTFLTLVSV